MPKHLSACFAPGVKVWVVTGSAYRSLEPKLEHHEIFQTNLLLTKKGNKTVCDVAYIFKGFMTTIEPAERVFRDKADAQKALAVLQKEFSKGKRK